MAHIKLCILLVLTLGVCVLANESELEPQKYISHRSPHPSRPSTFPRYQRTSVPYSKTHRRQPPSPPSPPTQSHRHSKQELKDLHLPSSSQGERPYNFEYNVQDDYQRTYFGHKETGLGEKANGEYYVYLPDGRIQTVTYYTDEKGFHPEIAYNGTDGQVQAFHRGKSDSKTIAPLKSRGHDETDGQAKSIHSGQSDSKTIAPTRSQGHDGTDGQAKAIHSGHSDSKTIAPSRSRRPQGRYGAQRNIHGSSPTPKHKVQQSTQHSGRHSGATRIIKRIRGPISRKPYQTPETRYREVEYVYRPRQHKNHNPSTTSLKVPHDINEAINYDTTQSPHDVFEPTIELPSTGYGVPKPTYGAPESGFKIKETFTETSKIIHDATEPSRDVYKPKAEAPSSGYGVPQRTHGAQKPDLKASGRTLEILGPFSEISKHVPIAALITNDNTHSIPKTPEVSIQSPEPIIDEEEKPAHFNTNPSINIADTLFRNEVEAIPSRKPNQGKRRN